MPERKPLLKIDVTVKQHTINKVPDKADTFAVGLKSNDGTLIIGMKEAKAKLSIKAEDDVLHYNFPNDEEFTIEIYSKRHSEALPPQPPTLQEPLEIPAGSS